MANALSLSKTLARSALGAGFALLACNSVLGIEDARVDPTLTLGAGGGSGQGNGGAPSSGGAGGGNSGASSGGAATGGAPIAGGGDAGQGGEGASVAQGGTSTGGSVSTGGNEQGGDAGAGGSAPAVSLCDQYCGTITQYCTGTSLQYKDLEQCLAVCKLFPQGVVGEPDGNTIACRTKYAGKARYAGGTELNAYCRQAGPGGDGRCGSNCDGFCAITMATCTIEDTPPYYFVNDSACHTTCQSLPSIPFVYGDITVADGNTVECRMFHVISAAMMDPEEHCEHVMGLTLCEK
jgi:hypothetical protein